MRIQKEFIKRSVVEGIYRKEKEMLKLMKQNDTFAIDLINDFIEEKLKTHIKKYTNSNIGKTRK